MSNAAAGKQPGLLDPETLGFDPAELRRKYALERDKRLRADGNEQFVEIAGEYAHFDDDPHTAPGYRRDALRALITRNLPRALA